MLRHQSKPAKNGSSTNTHNKQEISQRNIKEAKDIPDDGRTAGKNVFA